MTALRMAGHDFNPAFVADVSPIISETSAARGTDYSFIIELCTGTKIWVACKVYQDETNISPSFFRRYSSERAKALLEEMRSEVVTAMQ